MATTHYLDHAATTPLVPAAVDAVREAWPVPGNPSSAHAAGRRARRSVEDARDQIAADLGALPSEVVLTSGGTEADNLAIKGLFWSRRAADPGRRRILVGAVEHHAALDAAGWLGTHQGAEVETLPVDRDGRLRTDGLAAALERAPDDVALVSCMWANNEVGTVQPLAEVVGLAHAHGIPVHTDAVQAVASLPVDLHASGADALSVSGHKLGGPVGTGALLLRRGTDVTPLLHGGGQERDLRSGTVDVAGVRGFAAALQQAVHGRTAHAAHVGALRDELERLVLAEVDGVVVNGGADRLPGHSHLSFGGCDSTDLLLLLDATGIECSAASACSAGVPGASHVLLAMGRDPAVASGSLRLTFGHTSTAADVDAFVGAIGPAVERARAANLALQP